jgi:hypothetical protein
MLAQAAMTQDTSSQRPHYARVLVVWVVVLLALYAFQQYFS